MKRLTLDSERTYKALVRQAAVQDQDLFGFGNTIEGFIRQRMENITAQGPLTQKEVAEAQKDPIKPIETTTEVWALRRRLRISFGPGSPENG